MFVHRFRQQAALPPTPRPEAFVLCSLAWLQAQAPDLWQWQVAIYQMALAEAEAVTRPALPERDLLGV